MNCRVPLTLLVAVMLGCGIAGCSKPVAPSFFSGTWKPPDNVSGVGMAFIDIPRAKVVLGLGIRPREYVATQVTHVKGGFRLRLKDTESEDVVLELSLQRVSDSQMRITDEAGDSDIWSRAEAVEHQGN